jgi:hypothetical protein
MQDQVAVAAQREEVLLRIIPGLTPKFLVVDFQGLRSHRTTDTASRNFLAGKRASASE